MAADGCCVVGALAKLAVNSQRLEFIEFDPVRIVRMLSDGSVEAIRGTLDRLADDVVKGLLYVDFRTSFYMTAQNMALLLPIMGFSATGNTYKIGDTLASTTVILGLNSCPEFVYGNAFISKWVIRGVRGGDPPRIDVWWRAYTRSEQPSGTFFVSQSSPALLTEYPYPFAGGTAMTFGGQSYQFYQVAFGLDYHLVSEFNNSDTATNICPTDHDITIGHGMLYAPCDNTTTLLTTPFSGDVTGGAYTLSFTTTVSMTTYSTSFSLPNVKLIAQQPGVTNKHDFTRMPFNGRGYAQGTHLSMTCVNVAS